MLSNLKVWVENETYKYSYLHHTASLASENFIASKYIDMQNFLLFAK